MNQFTEALEGIQSGTARGTAIAIVRIRQVLDWPQGQNVTLDELRAWSPVLCGIALEKGDPFLVEASRSLVDAHADAVVMDLYQIGYQLIDLGMPALAATYLWRCQAIEPSETHVSEFVIALEDATLHEHAYQFLIAQPELRDISYTCQMLFGFNAAKTGRVGVALEVISDLWRRAREAMNQGHTIRNIEGFMMSVQGALHSNPAVS